MNKNKLTDLAILGGQPEFATMRHVGSPNLPDRSALLSAIQEVLESNRLTNDGPRVREFESMVSEICGGVEIVAVSSGTSALQLAIRAFDLSGEVIVPSLTFVATAQAVAWLGLEPVFADVDPETMTLDPVDVERKITDRTSAVIPVHLWGRICDVSAFDRLAEKYDIKIIYDACHALGCTRDNVPVGSFGDAEAFSFHATKFVNALEGGAIATTNHDVAMKLKAIRNFGMMAREDVEHVGTNAKMNEFSAAMGILSVADFDNLVDHNAGNYERYREILDGVPGIRILEIHAGDSSNYQYVVGLVDRDKTGISRDELIGVLRYENVDARRYFYPGCHRLDCFGGGNRFISLPVTESILDQVIVLPTGRSMSNDCVTRLASLIRLILEHGREINIDPALSNLAGATVA